MHDPNAGVMIGCDAAMTSHAAAHIRQTKHGPLKTNDGRVDLGPKHRPRRRDIMERIHTSKVESDDDSSSDHC